MSYISGRVMPTVWTATLDPALAARVVNRRALHYAGGPDAALDRPAHVRAASSIARLGAALVIVQDDAAFLALVDPEGGAVTDLPLPAGEGGVRLYGDDRGNKAAKLDLEAVVAIDVDGEPALLALGSGSTARRERVVLVRLGAERPSAQVQEAPELYRTLRSVQAFAGDELNVEGAFVDGEDLVLVQRGNGDPARAVAPVDATIRIELAGVVRHLLGRGPLPALRAPTGYRLGRVGEARLTFTDATRHLGHVLYVACAEASPDSVRDGPTSGVALGVLPLDGEPRYTLLVDETGAPCADKVEGLLSLGPDRLLAVVDRDDVSRPAELLEIAWSDPGAAATASGPRGS